MSDVVTTISYCTSPAANSLTTAITSANGSVDTSQAGYDTNRTIGLITEQHNYPGPGSPDTLGPEQDATIPAQSDTFRTMVTKYPDLWVPSNSNISICNTALWLGSNPGYFVATPLGCLGVSLP